MEALVFTGAEAEKMKRDHAKCIEMLRKRRTNVGEISITTFNTDNKISYHVALTVGEWIKCIHCDKATALNLMDEFKARFI